MAENQIIIDATDGVMGRIAAFAAKQALLGKSIVIVNCNDAVISGRPRLTIERYQQRRARGGSAGHGPFVLKTPERIMKRTVRGMLDHKHGRGATAYKRVMCYNAVPDEYASAEKMTFKRDIHTKTIKLSKLQREL